MATKQNVLSDAKSQEEANKIVSILLNKIIDLEWYYFNIKLSISELKNVLNKIDGSGSTLIMKDGDVKISSEVLVELIGYLRHRPALMEEVIHRIFNINLVLATSDATEAISSSKSGVLGKLNETETKRRRNTFQSKIRDGFKSNPDHVTIVAEGDSWFQFPRLSLPNFNGAIGLDVVKDVVDWLSDDDAIAVYSLAEGGDWLSNMLNNDTQQYITALSEQMPEVFLVGGGGNDFCGNRLSTMVRHRHHEGLRNMDELSIELQDLINMRVNDKDIDMEKYKLGLSLIDNNFFRFLNVCMVQYFTLFYKLLHTTDAYKGHMLILTHGYDYPRPKNGSNTSLFSHPLQYMVNCKLGTGKWLHEPLENKAITSQEEKDAVMYFIVHEFNEMLISVVKYHDFPNIFHVDCRGVTKESSDWYDELHPKSEIFGKIVKTMKLCIGDKKEQIKTAPFEIKADDKVYVVREIFP
jgi:hypothetical protein